MSSAIPEARPAPPGRCTRYPALHYTRSVTLRFELEPPDRLIVHLREGSDETSVAVSPASAGVASLTRALDEALADGYGECFWPGQPGGQYWWIFKREDAALELAVMWTRGGASLWEHVFRATDSAEWTRDLVREQARRLSGTWNRL